MIHPDTELRFIDDTVGHGVFATRFIPRGTLTWTLCRLDRVFRPAELAALPAEYGPILARYGYIDARGRTVLCWDLARYLNHSCEPASLGIGPDAEIAVRDIEPGEQLTTEYGSLNLAEPLHCRCGAPGCRGAIRAEDAVRFGEAWDRAVAPALARASHVDQPLRAFHRSPGALEALLHGTAKPPSHTAFYYRDPGRGGARAGPGPKSGGSAHGGRSPNRPVAGPMESAPPLTRPARRRRKDERVR